MAVYFVIGKLGSGKTLACVGRIKDALITGKAVATNLDLNLVKMLGYKPKQTRVYRLPDKPCLADFQAIGRGNETYQEEKNGLIVLDECGTWFNSRNWNDKGRAEILNWFLHARKLGWDICFIVQSIEVVDKQARETLAEHVVTCMRTDRLPIPLVGGLLKLLSGFKINLPKIHVGVVRYGDSANSLIVDRWWYRGRDLYKSYDTKQVFRESEFSTYMLLPPYHQRGRYMKPKGFWDYKTRAHRLFIKYPGFILTLFSVVAGSAIHLKLGTETIFIKEAIASEVAVQQELKSSIFSYLDQLRIIGEVVLDSKRTILFENAEGETLSDNDLRRNGYRVRYNFRCSATVWKGEERKDVTCSRQA